MQRHSIWWVVNGCQMFQSYFPFPVYWLLPCSGLIIGCLLPCLLSWLFVVCVLSVLLVFAVVPYWLWLFIGFKLVHVFVNHWHLPFLSVLCLVLSTECNNWGGRLYLNVRARPSPWLMCLIVCNYSGSDRSSTHGVGYSLTALAAFCCVYVSGVSFAFLDWIRYVLVGPKDIIQLPNFHLSDEHHIFQIIQIIMDISIQQVAWIQHAST